jgi:hypothetical protein
MRKVTVSILLENQTEEDFSLNSDEEVLKEFITYYNLKKQRDDFKLIKE